MCIRDRRERHDVIVAKKQDKSLIFRSNWHRSTCNLVKLNRINIVILCYFLMLYAFSHSSISYALFRYALYTVVTHVSYANSVTRFIPRALRSYAFYTQPLYAAIPVQLVNVTSPNMAAKSGWFLPRDAMLSAVHVVVMYLSVGLSVCVCLLHFGIV